jgi:hypothetical protein
MSSFNEAWSEGCYTFTNSSKTANFAKASTQQGISNYKSYPGAKLNQLPFTSTFTVEFSLSGSGWFGLISPGCSFGGFPGYTDQGWMICTDGRLWHNNAEVINHPIKLQPHKKALFQYFPLTKTMKVTVDYIPYTYTVNNAPQKFILLFPCQLVVPPSTLARLHQYPSNCLQHHLHFQQYASMEEIRSIASKSLSSKIMSLLQRYSTL